MPISSAHVSYTGYTLDVLPSVLAVILPKRSTVLVQHERYWHKQQAQEAEQTRGPTHAELGVHRRSEERETRTNCTSVSLPISLT